MLYNPSAMSEAPSPLAREFIPCNLCGGANHARWARVGAATVVRCRACGLVFTNPRLPVSALHESYEEEYGDVHEDEALLTQRRRMYEIERGEIVRMAKGGPPPALRADPSPQGRGTANGDDSARPRFLDVGCGTGEFLALLQEDFDVYGVEVSQRYLKIAAERYSLPHLVAGELTGAGFEADFFDVVQMRGVLQHLPDPSAQLAEALRVTRPGGLIVISATPNIASPAARIFRAHFRLLAPDQMVYDFSPRTLRLMLEKAGYRVERFAFPYVRTPYFRWYQPAQFVALPAYQLFRRHLFSDHGR